MFSEVESWEDLAKAIMAMPEEDRKRPIQCAMAPCVGGRPVELQPGIAFGWVAAMGFAGSRSVYDNRYHQEDIVLMLDHNPFGEKGETMYELKDGEFCNPRYLGGKPTPREEQMAPSPTPCPRDFLLPSEMAVIKRRMEHPE